MFFPNKRESGNNSSYCSESMIRCTSRFIRDARSSEYEHEIICSSGFRPRANAGRRRETNSDLVCRGGAKIIRRLMSPETNRSRYEQMVVWCQFSRNVGNVKRVNSIMLKRALVRRCSSNNATNSASLAVNESAFFSAFFARSAATVFSSEGGIIQKLLDSRFALFRGHR